MTRSGAPRRRPTIRRYAGGLRGGAETWSLDGKTVGARFPRLTEEEGAWAITT